MLDGHSSFGKTTDNKLDRLAQLGSDNLCFSEYIHTTYIHRRRVTRHPRDAGTSNDDSITCMLRFVNDDDYPVPLCIAQLMRAPP